MGDDDGNHADFCITVCLFFYVPSLTNPNLLYHSLKSPTNPKLPTYMARLPTPPYLALSYPLQLPSLLNLALSYLPRQTQTPILQTFH